ncbi:AI-2E family transporter [Candidatus Anaplasma sp. TIGMIC]|uniref:AI-2E family transporter n=1 Tax=Candidatus Anaplasma sp. TIGMIC TaxID=3020713 RepID=UPI00233013F1|nr:AI-2E family transporter [Candidatus Anaplasma sp. TIGMIC]MDB1135033.1 AI-2E family transporter [Candidatus Anaplasma sp. TIGMIC]
MKYVNLFLVAIAVVALVVVVRPVLCSCCFAVVIAYLLNPVVNRMEAVGLPRMVSSFAIVFSCTCVLGALVVFLTPILYSQALGIVKLLVDRAPFIDLKDLKGLLSASGLPSYRDIINDTGDPLSFVTKSLVHGDNAELLKLLNSASGYFGKAVVGVAHSSIGVGASIIKMLLTLLLSFYILGSWNSLLGRINDLVPPRHRVSFLHCARRVDEVIAAYLRGQTLVCLLLSCYYCVCFVVMGLDYSLILGFVSGLMTFVPYVGPILCCVLGVGISMSQGLGLAKAATVVLMFIVGQTVESNVITPLIVGKKLSLNQVWIVLGMVVFSSHAGIAGALLAVPVTAILSVFTQFVVEKYTTSRFYLGR